MDSELKQLLELQLSWWKRSTPATLTEMLVGCSSIFTIEPPFMPRDLMISPYEAAIGQVTSIKAEQLIHRARSAGKANVYRVNWTGSTAVLKGFFHTSDMKNYTGTDAERSCAHEAYAYHLLQDVQCVPKFHGVYQLSYPGINGKPIYRLALLMEHFNGVNLDEIKDPSKIPTHIRYKIITRILEGLYSLLQAGIYHHSVHPRNILIGKEYTCIKIIDLGRWAAVSPNNTILEYLETHARLIHRYFGAYVEGLSVEELKKLAREILERCPKEGGKENKDG